MERRVGIGAIPDDGWQVGAAKPARFEKTEGQEIEESDPASQRLADVGHQVELLRPCQ